jgi:hypothetical protein
VRAREGELPLLGGRPCSVAGGLALGSLPTSLLQPASHLHLPLTFPAWSPEPSAALAADVVLVDGAPRVDSDPPRGGDATLPTATPSGVAPARIPSRPTKVSGGPCPSPGTVFLDSILGMFHSMVASAVAGSCELVQFWVTPTTLSPWINRFWVANALNFRFTAYPNSFLVLRHGRAKFSSFAVFPAIRDLLLHKTFSLGRTSYCLNRTASDADAAVACLPAWPPCSALALYSSSASERNAHALQSTGALSTPGFLSPDAYCAIHRNPRILFLRDIID